jgi:predicted RNase H-like HicB family nuclease
MRYVAAIEKGDKKHAYGVVVPDLPGCLSAGDTLDEALSNVKEAILLHLGGLMNEKIPVSVPKLLEAHQKGYKYKGWTWAVVEVDLMEIDDKTERINIPHLSGGYWQVQVGQDRVIRVPRKYIKRLRESPFVL